MITESIAVALKYGVKIKKRIYWSIYMVSLNITCQSCEVVSAAVFHVGSAVHSPGGDVFSHTSLEMGTLVLHRAIEVQVAKR